MATPPVYSVALATGGLDGAGSVDYFVPDGFMWIIRDVDLTYYADPVFGGQAYMDTFAGAAVFATAWPASASQYYGWRGRQVVPGGSGFTMIITGDGSPVAAWAVSGYQLSLP
jgi:hypothetical protein